MKRALLLLLFCVARSAFARICPYEPSEAVADTLDPLGYYPVDVGNVWEYSLEDWWNGVEYEYERNEIVGDTTLDGVRYARFRTTRYAPQGTDTLAVLSSGQSLFTVSDSGLVYPDGSFREERFGADFRTCYTPAGSNVVVPVHGGYGEGNPSRIATKVLQGSLRRTRYVRGWGPLSREKIGRQAEATFVKIGSAHFGLPLESRFTVLPPGTRQSLATPDTLRTPRITLHNTGPVSVSIDSIAFSQSLWYPFVVYLVANFAEHQLVSWEEYDFPRFVLLPNETATWSAELWIATKHTSDDASEQHLRAAPGDGAIIDTLFIYWSTPDGATHVSTVFLHEDLMPVGTQEEADQLENQLGVYPNPAYSTATIDLRLGQASNVRFTLTDLLGRRAGHESRLLLSRGPNQHRIDVSALPSGTYFLVARICPFGGGTCSVIAAPVTVIR